MKELAKNFDPSVVEERLYFLHRNAAPEYYRAAAHGTCTGQHHAGYPDSLEKNGRLQRTLGTRH